jgi:predicted metalloenzyme YecM
MTTTFETQVIEILNDLVRKVSRLETRLMRLAEEMNVNVTKLKGKQDENVQ